MSLSAVHDHVGPRHLVQLYGSDNRSLIKNVSRFLAEALEQEGGALVIATPEHRDAIYRKLWSQGISPFAAEEEHRLIMLDAGKTMAQFMVGGKPDWDRFESVIGGALRRVRTGKATAARHAFGEIVALLWKAKRFSEAVCLEQYWNRLLQSSGFSLFCGYPVDVFSTDFHGDAMDAVLCAHSHLLPTNDKLESVLHHAMDEVLGPLGAMIRERYVEQEPSQPSRLPPGEGLVRWLRTNLPEDADEILRLARRHFHDSQQLVARN